MLGAWLLGGSSNQCEVVFFVLAVAETAGHSNGGLWCALVDLCEDFSIQIQWLLLAARTGEMQPKGSSMSFGRSHSGQFAFSGEMNYMDGGLT